MNFDRITNPIETQDVEIHEAELKKKLVSVQLSFADRKFSELSKGNKDINFSEVLEKYTAVGTELEKAYYRKFAGSYKEEEHKEYIAVITQQINHVYKASPEGGVERVYRTITEEIDRLESLMSAEEKRQEPERDALYAKEEKRAGIFNYGFDSDQFDSNIEIHVQKFFKQGIDKFGPEALADSFQKLAVDIVDKYPQVGKISGHSWLMSHPLMRRLGFKITEKDQEEKMLQAPQAWWQFMDKGGQINAKRLQEFAQSGELPLPVVRGEIAVEDFLRLYLPKERRGEVVLKRMSSENKEKFKQFKTLGERVQLEWENLSPEALKALIFGNELVGGFIQASEVGKEYLDSLVEMKGNNIPIETVSETLKEKNKIFQKQLDAYLAQNLLVDTKISIE